MAVQTKNAGGRNLAGQRASTDASKLTLNRDAGQIAAQSAKGKGARQAGRPSLRLLSPARTGWAQPETVNIAMIMPVPRSTW